MYIGRLLHFLNSHCMVISMHTLAYLDAQVLDYNLLATLVAHVAYMLPDFKRQLKSG